ncbi:Ycf66 family protein, partial [Limnothrix sp. PR1529]|uniref:Ycf66 family protein n=1 Tax=Limnothrix sp. PR1529 TaxID=1704291 RepID=UPI0026F421E1
MLAYGLAILVAIGSLLLYAIALRFPILSRRSDVIWSSFGLFYALVLWVCSGQLHGAVLLSQGVVVGLMAWQGWQTLVLREQVARSSLDEVLVAALPQFDRWAGLLNLFRPGQPNLTGWQAFRQSLTGFGIVLWIQIQTQLANLRASRSPGSSPAPMPNSAPKPTPKPTPSPTPPPTNAATAPPAPVSPTTGSTGQSAEQSTGQSAGQPVYVRKKYRQPPEGAPPNQTTPSSAPSPEPVPEGSKPVYVRKKYR